MKSTPQVVVVGPASWNHLIVLDRLPEPVPHMQFAEDSFHAVGGTSAGKALHLAASGVPTRLHALLGDDADGREVAEVLRRAGVDLVAHPSDSTERHVNLMTRRGERVSLYVSTPSDPDAATLAAVARDAAAADVAVVDLSSMGALLLPLLAERRPAERRPAERTHGERTHGERTPAERTHGEIWTDLHDYDGESAFHEPFLRAAEVVFMNDDRTDDPWQLLASCVRRGPGLAVCTLGARGAIALDAAGRRAQVEASPVDVVDTNGAGDAFFAGFLAARLGGASTAECLRAGADQAVEALSTRQLHPSLAD